MKTRSVMSSRKLVYVFAKHVYLSFIVIPTISKELKSVRVRVKERDVIRKFSDASLHVLSEHYETYSSTRTNKSEECAITQLGVYTREVLVEYHFEGEGVRLLPDVEFFAVPGLGNSLNGACHGLGCPAEPQIRHSTRRLSFYGAKVHVSNQCDPGYQMIDPITQRPSDGILKCHKNFEWQPYPFPECRKIINSSSATRAPSQKPQITEEENNRTTTVLLLIISLGVVLGLLEFVIVALVVMNIREKRRTRVLKQQTTLNSCLKEDSEGYLVPMRNSNSLTTLFSAKFTIPQLMTINPVEYAVPVDRPELSLLE